MTARLGSMTARDTARRWAAAVAGSDFRFSFKLPRFLTHEVRPDDHDLNVVFSAEEHYEDRQSRARAEGIHRDAGNARQRSRGRGPLAARLAWLGEGDVPSAVAALGLPGDQAQRLVALIEGERNLLDDLSILSIAMGERCGCGSTVRRYRPPTSTAESRSRTCRPGRDTRCEESTASPLREGKQSARDLYRLGRHILYRTPFAAFEAETRKQLAAMFGPTGFDADRDIEAITVNRWSRGYAYEYMQLFDPEWQDGQAPHELGRKPIGRISIANSDSEASRVSARRDRCCAPRCRGASGRVATFACLCVLSFVYVDLDCAPKGSKRAKARDDQSAGPASHLQVVETTNDAAASRSALPTTATVHGVRSPFRRLLEVPRTLPAVRRAGCPVTTVGSTRARRYHSTTSARHSHTAPLAPADLLNRL
jgi:hypothetical protein